MLRFPELGARLSGPLDEEPTPPMLVLFPWAATTRVGVALEDVGPS